MQSEPLFHIVVTLALNEMSTQLPSSSERTWKSVKAYEARLLYLRQQAAHDGCELNLASKSDFTDFIQTTDGLHRGNLVLLDNGNLRLVWKDNDATQLALQFLGGNMIQFVIFKKRVGTEQMTRVAGRDSLYQITDLISAFDLQSLVFK